VRPGVFGIKARSHTRTFSGGRRPTYDGYPLKVTYGVLTGWCSDQPHRQIAAIRWRGLW